MQYTQLTRAQVWGERENFAPPYNTSTRPWMKSLYESVYEERTLDVDNGIDEIIKLLTLDYINVFRPEQVRVYLQDHADMIRFVTIVCETAVNLFGADTHLSLELYQDPEIDDSYLTLYVRQENYDKRTTDTIKSLRTAYAEELAKKSGWFIVTTDFRPSRA
jgi:hypothetical protein